MNPTPRLSVLFTALLVGCAPSPEATTPSPPSHYAQVGGLSMYYEVHGSGPPLVLLHGGGSTLETSFGKVLPLLARTHRVIAVEEQGHGHTADLDRPLSFAQMADDTAALLEKLGVPQADLLGFSNGGVVALEVAIRHPAVVHRLVLASAFSRRDGLVPALWAGFPHATVDSMPAALQQGYLRVAPHPEALPTLFRKTVTMMMGFQDIDDAALRAIESPTLVMVGDSDVVLPEHALAMSRTIPRAELAVFPAATHGAYLGVAEAGEVKDGRAMLERAVATVDEFLAR